MLSLSLLFLFFFNETTTTDIYTLSLHDALPIYSIRPLHLHAVLILLRHQILMARRRAFAPSHMRLAAARRLRTMLRDRKSTRLNSSHANISYAVFCLKKKRLLFSV